MLDQRLYPGRGTEEEGRIMKKVVIAIDGSDVSRGVVDYALHYAEREKNVDVMFLHVVEWRDYREIHAYGGQALSVPPNEEEVKNEFDKFVKEQIKKTGIKKPGKMSINILFGNPYNEIVTFAEKVDADLIMIGHRGLGDLERFFQGSVASKVVAHSPCSVYVHREKGSSKGEV
jgi:nucleotide-binding universal stress UspA family protein